MKLSKEQRLSIQQNLSKAVRYNETYLELYDHVISALEAQESITDLQQAYSNILEGDFGGKHGVVNLERSLKKSIRAHIIKMYRVRLAYFFGWPGVLILALLAVMAHVGSYVILGHKTLTWLSIVFINLLCFTLPWVFAIVRNFMVALRYRELKESVFYSVLSGTLSRPFNFYFIIQLFCFVYHIGFNSWVDEGLLVTIMVHAIVFYSMSISELKERLSYGVK